MLTKTGVKQVEIVFTKWPKTGIFTYFGTQSGLNTCYEYVKKYWPKTGI